MSQTHVIVHAAGWLEGGLTASYEQFVLDLEMLEGMATFTAGLRVDDASLALDTIVQVGPGGSYMLTDHTLANFRLASYLSSLVDSRPHEARQSGSQTLLERANSVWKGWLSEYEEPPLDPAVHEAVRDYVLRRQRGDPAPALLR
jgi:trimethylamine--corrinoid protein Co-methyltransferase